MAEEQEAAPEVTPEETPAKGGGMRTMIICLVIALVAGGAGFAVPMMFPSMVGSEAAVPEEPSPPQSVFVPMGEIVVNLNEDRLNRYLRISITFQVDSEHETEVTEVVEKKSAILKSWLLGYLSDKGLEDIRGAAGQNRIRREIQDHFNEILFSDGLDRINDILFEEFNVQ